MKKKTLFILTGVVLVAVIILFSLSGGKASSFPAVDDMEDGITIYKSSTCGCCGIYSNYFRKQGNSDVRVQNLEDLDMLKDRYGVPPALESCHTTVIGGYFVEGHIPLEAIERLLQEKPDIKGIAMPGMPSGSPGMPGAKSKDFVIYAVNHDGTYEEWMRI